MPTAKKKPAAKKAPAKKYYLVSVSLLGNGKGIAGIMPSGVNQFVIDQDPIDWLIKNQGAYPVEKLAIPQAFKITKAQYEKLKKNYSFKKD